MSIAGHGRRGRALAAVAVLALLGALAAAPPAGAISRAQAEKRALRILDPQHAGGRIVVFGRRQPVGAGRMVGEASPMSSPLAPYTVPGTTRRLRGVSQKIAPGITLRHGVWLFWEDLVHGAAFEHPSRLLLLNRTTGRVVLDRRLSWWPQIDGKNPRFVDDDHRDRVLYVSGPDVLSRRAPRFAPLAPVAIAAAQRLGGPSDCLFVIGDRTSASNAPRLFGNSLDAMKDFAASHGLPPSEARTANDLFLKVYAAVKYQGCKDVMIFLAGHGSPAPDTPDPLDPATPMTGTDEPTVEIGTFKDPTEDKVYSHPITGAMLRRLMGLFPPSVKFKIVIFSCFSGRFVDALRDDPHIKDGGVIAGSSAADEYSVGRVESGTAGGIDGLIHNTNPIANPVKDPLNLPGYVDGIITELGKILDDPQAYKADGGSLAAMVHDAHVHSLAEDFTAQLGWNHPVDAYSPPPPPPSGTIITNGSALTPTADDIIKSQQDEDIWSQIIAYCLDHPEDQSCPHEYRSVAGRQAPSQNSAIPVDGQILAVRVKGMAVPSGQPGDPGPLTEIHFSVLRPQPDGSVKVIVSSQAFNLPSTGDPNQITEFKPTNMCAEKGDFLALSTEGGFDPTYYPGGVPFQILAHVPRSSIAYFSQHNGVQNGAQFTGQTQSDTELLMQWDIGTGNQATALCKGGTKTR